MTSLDFGMCGTEAQSLETAPENQPPINLNPNLSSKMCDMVDTTDFQPSSSPAITNSAGSGAEAIPLQPIPSQPLSPPVPTLVSAT
ncbi:hypothetical protein PAXRUDRAFT_18465 [Paxillus rubicundulus Ve08.2h10]|uniref:Uncharacterized protein n=1 Tax=Paxillus rubicundulus Ve08.2h10 TaxID=930991 RepID=A0A0D0CXZ8_9AGAM|nr:hypothetical protein PAXRUDRAFT_18465 [Paxillus rubicundulus Ve08.2h10]